MPLDLQDPQMLKQWKADTWLQRLMVTLTSGMALPKSRGQLMKFLPSRWGPGCLCPFTSLSEPSFGCLELPAYQSQVLVRAFYHSNRRDASLLPTSLLEESLSHHLHLDWMFVRSVSSFCRSGHQVLFTRATSLTFGVLFFHFHSILGILSFFLDFNSVSFNLHEFVFSVASPTVR